MNKNLFSYGKYIHQNFGKLNKKDRINKIKYFLDNTRGTYSKSFYMIPYHQQYENRDFNSKQNHNIKNINNYQKFYDEFNPYKIKKSHVSQNLASCIRNYYDNIYQQK